MSWGVLEDQIYACRRVTQGSFCYMSENRNTSFINKNSHLNLCIIRSDNLYPTHEPERPRKAW